MEYKGGKITLIQILTFSAEERECLNLQSPDSSVIRKYTETEWSGLRLPIPIFPISYRTFFWVEYEWGWNVNWVADWTHNERKEEGDGNRQSLQFICRYWQDLDIMASLGYRTMNYKVKWADMPEQERLMYTDNTEANYIKVDKFTMKKIDFNLSMIYTPNASHLGLGFNLKCGTDKPQFTSFIRWRF